MGLFDDFTPKFVKKFVNLNEIIKNAVGEFKKEVEGQIFPDTSTHSYSLPDEELKKFEDSLDKKESKKLKDFVK